MLGRKKQQCVTWVYGSDLDVTQMQHNKEKKDWKKHILIVVT